MLIVFSSYGQNTYYVDNSNGNDSNSGISPSLAWQTISKINNQTFLPGDTILFKKGEEWTNQKLEISAYAGAQNNPIVFSAYPQAGTVKPIISTIIEHSHTWISQGGNLWKASNPPTFHPDRLWVNGTEILRANSSTELDGINFLWLYDKDENGDLYLYSNTNPASKHISYTNGTVNLIIEDASYITFSKLNLQGGWTSIFILGNVSHIGFNEMEIGKNAANGININSGDASTPSQIKVENCTFDANFSLNYAMAGTYDGSDARGCSDGIFIQNATNCEIANNFFKNWGHSSINIDGNPNGSGSVKVSNISVHHNYLTSPDIIYGGRMAVDDAHHCEVFNNQIINTSVQSQLDGYSNHFHHNIIDGTTNPPIVAISEEISAGISVESYSSTEVYDNTYEHNLIKNTAGAGFRFTTSGFFNIHHNTIRNNIIYNCGAIAYETGIGISVQTNTTICHTSENIFSTNLVFNNNTVNTVDFRGTVTNITGFNALSGTSAYQILGNITGNPLFVDVNNEDYHLTANSPCINAGTNTLVTQDFEGNPIPLNSTLPDIGIYEYQAALALDYLLVLQAARQENKVLLTWSSTSEQNNDYFLLERSQNAINWTSIGRIEGKGNSSSSQTYKFLDSTTPAKNVYYRLKQIDFDKHFSYSNIASIFFEKIDFSLYPIPAKDFFILKNPLDIKHIKIYNSAGVFVKEEIFQNKPIDISKLSNGLYFIQIETSKGISIKKILKVED